MRLTQTLSDAVDEQKYVGAVFFDLKKAFDRVWHKGLLAKIRFARVTGGAHEWLASYLSERHQVTLVDGQFSLTNKLHAGVPQGAILSPLLFCVFMNDMPCRDFTNLFADDTSSYVIESNAAKLEEKLQLRTNNICIWFSKWLLSVNTEKTAIMVFILGECYLFVCKFSSTRTLNPRSVLIDTWASSFTSVCLGTVILITLY